MSLTNEDKVWIAEQFDATERMTDGKLATLEATVRAAEERTIEAMRDMQTEILKGIEAFARGNFARMHRLETSAAATVEQLAALEERVLRLETRRPPNA